MKGLTTSTARRVATRIAPRATRTARRSGGPAPRILVLTSGLGSGHARAAEAIAQAVRRLEPQAVVRQLDFWSLMNPGVAATIKDKYLELVTHCPELYARLHRLDERTWRRVIENDIAPPPEVLELIELLSRNDGAAERRSLTSVAEWALGPYPSDLLLYPTACATFPVAAGERAGNNAALLRLALLKWAFQRLQARMEQRLQEFAPDVVVATQMVPAALVSALKTSAPRWQALPLVGVLTDFGAHDYWRQAGIDLYCVPHEQLAGRPLARNGAVRRKVWASGAPLMHAFERPPDRAVARARLGITDAQGHTAVLLLGGGLGLGLEHLVEPLLQRLPDCTVIAMAGQNADALQRLHALQREWPERLLARGWTEHMEHYIVAADLVVGKAGGLTVAEVLACGRPLLVTTSLQGQEAFNVQFLERERVGRFVAEADLADVVAQWVADPAALAAVQERAWHAGRRDGAGHIAGRVLEFAGAPHAEWLPGALQRSPE